MSILCILDCYANNLSHYKHCIYVKGLNTHCSVVELASACVFPKLKWITKVFEIVTNKFEKKFLNIFWESFQDYSSSDYFVNDEFLKNNVM